MQGLTSKSKEIRTMTKEEILAMSAGPELDDLVARHVMNLDDTSFHYDVEMGISERIKYNDFIDDHIWVSFNPSTDISAAWEVVEKIGGMEEWMLYRVSHSDTVDEVDLGYACELLNVKRGYSVACEAITAPVAICKAALLAVSEGKDEE
jgi:hypothetical protein